jgi:hypothetical protein
MLIFKTHIFHSLRFFCFHFGVTVTLLLTFLFVQNKIVEISESECDVLVSQFTLLTK